jgi:hypothetical protein
VAVRIADNPRDDVAGAWVRHEYDVLRLMDDPRLPRTFGYYASQIAVSTSWIEGVGLDQILVARAEGKLTVDPATAVDILVEVAEALRHIHARADDKGAIFHGWLSPQTIYLRHDGRVMIGGLGAMPRPVPAGYVPPEEAAGAFVDARSDQWRLGALGVELLLGNTLYHGAPDQEAAALDGKVEPWLARVERRWPAMSRCLAKLLSPAAGTRYGTESELIKDLLEVGRALGRPDRLALVSRARALMTAAAARVEVEGDPFSEDRPLDPARTEPGADRGRSRANNIEASTTRRTAPSAAGRTSAIAAAAQRAAAARNDAEDVPTSLKSAREASVSAASKGPEPTSARPRTDIWRRDDGPELGGPRPISPASDVGSSGVDRDTRSDDTDAPELPPVLSHRGPTLGSPRQDQPDDPSFGLGRHAARGAPAAAEPSFGGLPRSGPAIQMPEPSFGGLGAADADASVSAPSASFASSPSFSSSSFASEPVGPGFPGSVASASLLTPPANARRSGPPVVAAPDEVEERADTDPPDAPADPEDGGPPLPPFKLPVGPTELVAIVMIAIFVVVAISYLIGRFG